MMNLILWCYVEVEDYVMSDFVCQLIVCGCKDVQVMVKWLCGWFEMNIVIFVSLVVCIVQIVEVLIDQYWIVDVFVLGGGVDDVLMVVGWLEGIVLMVVIVGYQLMIGSVVVQLVVGDDDSWSVKKGGIVWLVSCMCDGNWQVVLWVVLMFELV